REPAKGFDEVMSAVLGNQSAHEQDVPAGDEPVLREVSAWCCGHGFGAIRDVRRPRWAISGEIVLLDTPGVSDNAVRQPSGPALGSADVPPRDAAPLLPLPIEPIDVENHSLPDETRDPRHRAAADVEEKGDVITLGQCVDRREKAVRDGVEVLAPNGRQLDQAHPAIRSLRVGDLGNPALHGNPLPAGREPAAQFFGASLEPAVTGWYTAGTEHGDADQGPKARAAMGHLQIMLRDAGGIARSRGALKRNHDTSRFGPLRSSRTTRAALLAQVLRIR